MFPWPWSTITFRRHEAKLKPIASLRSVFSYPKSMVGGEDNSNGDNAEDGARKIRVGKTVFNIDAEGL